MTSHTLSTDRPVVTLRNAPVAAFDGAIAAARTCYAPRVVLPAEVTDLQRESIGRLTYEGGHHTVYQHAHFEFGLENVSRQFVWSVLHSHPFYNSEQQSQRYVTLHEPRAFVPPLGGEARDVYERAVLDAWASYRRLADLLRDETFAILRDLRYLGPKADPARVRKVEREAEKKAIETARYVIPLAAFTAMVHTVSGITLYRLWRMAASGDAPAEARAVIGAMVEAVRAHDPHFIDTLAVTPLDGATLPEQGVPKAVAGADAVAATFDRTLGGRVSRLIDHSPRAERVVADAVRAVFGLAESDLDDDDAIDRVLNPARNAYRLDSLNLSYHSPLMRALHHPSYTFAKRLSHTADSQDQRHRLVPGSRPLMTFVDTERPDFVMPRIIAAHPTATAEFTGAMERAWAAKNRLLRLGVPLDLALYVLPNAKALRFIESGPLIALVHKWTMRTCFNAQEEIYLASMDEIQQLAEVHPRLGRHLGPPCVVRNGLVSPRCTEGTHFCGVPVWRDFPAVLRRL